jgi:hypothetical protein
MGYAKQHCYCTIGEPRLAGPQLSFSTGNSLLPVDYPLFPIGLSTPSNIFELFDNRMIE